ncbi:MAG: glycosyl hydrolase 53 family protein, partial [Rhodoluna sp.]|nr:glycosyl hydrolase 53 family protein [Rhodoluna sp.]
MKNLAKLLSQILIFSLLLTVFTYSSSNAAAPVLQNGADVSWLPEVEQAGSKFFDAKGRRIDPLLLMKQSGLKTARVRLWVNPPTEHSSIGEVLALAKRIKKAGLSFVLDLHYSDWWADPGSQRTPAAWQELGQPELEQKVADYTADVLNRFARQQTSPQWVQIGNEIANGMLWPT